MDKEKYTARITRKTPSAFVFMLDRSGSMEEKILFNGEVMTKAVALSRLINNSIAELVSHCKREEGYRDYLDIAVIGYGGDRVSSLLPPGGSHPVFRKPGELAYAHVPLVKIFRERELPDGHHVMASLETREWVQPQALGKTPMFGAFEKCYRLLYEWTRCHAAERCFPPVVINITDGEATDAEAPELLHIAEKLRELSTADGNVLLMNIYLGGDSSHPTVLFPSSEEQLPESPYSKLLFGMSTPMPPIYHPEIVEITGLKEVEGCRGMSYNTSMTDLVGMLNIGSISVSLMS